MLFPKGLRAGVLLYALLITAIFSLLLTFYLSRRDAAIGIYKAGLEKRQALAMAYLTKEDAEKQKGKQGSLAFVQGQATYQKEKDQLHVEVQTSSGFNYSFSLRLKEETDKEPSSSEEKKEGKESRDSKEREASPSPSSADKEDALAASSEQETTSP